MLHPDFLLDIANDQHQDRLRAVEIRRLAKEARQQRAHFLGQLLQRLLVAAKQQLNLSRQLKSTTANPASLRR